MARLLVVEDEPDLLLILRIALEGAHHDVRLAADGEAALSRLRREHFDAVILDVMMPVLDGWQVLSAIQRCSDPPQVLVMSAADTPANRVRAEDLGAACFVAKPFDADRLLERLDALVPPARSSSPRPPARKTDPDDFA